MIPTLEEYKKARIITDAFESEERRLSFENCDNFRKELSEYFDNNLVGGRSIKNFSINHTFKNYFDIIPIDPNFDENYDGENDEDITKLSKKHNIHASFIYWMYPK